MPLALRVRVAGDRGGSSSHSEPYACDWRRRRAMRAGACAYWRSMERALQLGLCADLRVACRSSYYRDAQCMLLGGMRGKI